MRAKQITERFFSELPAIQRLLMTDVQAAYEGDPAAVNPAETLLCYPGVTAIAYQRMAHYLYKEGVKLIPRIVTEYAHSLTGIDIHPGAQIGPSFFIDHGTGVVIGETCVIGAHVKLYQGVTLGAKSFPLDENGNPVKGIKRHPNLEDHVIIYAESTVLGNVTIGKNSTIGANKWITQDIPPNSKI
jgi:serine O-acetyltransferase